jgi:thiol-disulfide isomerase/thioredoxin
MKFLKEYKYLIFTALAIVGVWFGKKWYLAPALSNGATAPNFVSTMPDGSRFELSSLKGNVILLDFWASWCGPCRRELPDIVEAYESFKDKGFTVVSVSLDNRKDKWMSAIADENLSWKWHVSELKDFDDSTATLYGVKEIPTKYLIDETGVIIAVNPSKGRLLTILNERLSK